MSGEGPEMIVRETIEHGDYRNVREQEIEPTWEGFVELLRDSPYKPAKELLGNRWLTAAFDELMSTGSAMFGWAHFTVVK